MPKPVKIFKIGAVRASVFHNKITKQGKEIIMPKVVIQVRYKDKSGQWKGTNSLSIADLPKAILALQKAYEFIVANNEKNHKN